MISSILHIVILLAVISFIGINCYSSVRCRENQFTCTQGKCIEAGYMCNGRDDCGDNSDEAPIYCRKYRYGAQRRKQVGPRRKKNRLSPRPVRQLAPASQSDIDQQDAAMQLYLTQLRLNLIAPPELRNTTRLRLLWLCVGAFQKLTKGEILTQAVTTDGFAKFYSLLQGAGLSSHDDTDTGRYTAIKGILSNCSSKPLTFTRIGHDCPKHMTFVPVQVSKMGVGIAFDPYNVDLLVEMMWKLFSFVHILCFPAFSSDFNLHHVLQTQIESLFSIPIIQQRWHRSTGGFSKMEHLFSTSSMNVRMQHLDSAVRDAYDSTDYKKWLVRPKL